MFNTARPYGVPGAEPSAATRLQQVPGNLIENAAKYTQAGGMGELVVAVTGCGEPHPVR